VKETICFIIFANVFIFSSEIFAQAAPQDAAGIRREQEAKERAYERLQKPISPRTDSGNQPNVTFGARKALPFRQKLTSEQKRRLLPEEDSAKYASFLKQTKTGLIKLFPDVGCEENANIIRADRQCLNWIPNSAFYSFREREHTTEYLADIRLEKDFLISDGVLSQGILVALGSVPLDNVTLDSAGMNFLVNYQPEQKNKDAYRQTVQITRGIKADKFLYKNTLPAIADTTYALRVIAYRGRFLQTFRRFRFNMLDGDKRTDLTLAFRVVRKSEDGSISLLWKELQRKDAPKLIYEKRKK